MFAAHAVNDTITPALPEKYTPAHAVNDVNIPYGGDQSLAAPKTTTGRGKQWEVGPGAMERTRRRSNHVDKGQAPTTGAPP